MKLHVNKKMHSVKRQKLFMIKYTSEIGEELVEQAKAANN